MKRLIALIAGFMLTTTANAQLINIDFGFVDTDVYTGQGILGGATDTFWNSVDFMGATNLAFSDGTAGASGVGVTFNTNWSNVGGSASNTLLGDRIIGLPSQTEIITISGLAANSSFDIVLYNGFYAQEYSIVGQPGVGTATTVPDTDSPTTDFPNWVEGVEYAILNSVTSDASGQLQIQDLPIAGGPDVINSALAGLQIQQIHAVPLPPAVWLFGSGLLWLAGIARRRRNA